MGFVIARLREYEAELKMPDILHLRLHGSLARGTPTATSDVDLIAELDATKHLSLLDMIGLENRLSDLIGARDRRATVANHLIFMQIQFSDHTRSPISFASYRWQKHCRGLYQTPIAA
jgi:predicted nucleotidyltransferase